MSTLLSCRALSKAYGGRQLFDDLTLAIHSGERVGLIGPNGSGKSTFLQILAGLQPPDDGERALRKGVRLGYLPQEESFADGSVEELVLAAVEDEDLDEVTRRTRARIALGRVGFKDLSTRTAELSGGWRKRLGLARVLAAEPDLVLLDEPTNHLDLSGIAWLEKLIAGARFASLVVTHDRYFLERVANRIVEIGRHYPGGHLRTEGGYSEFLVKREAFLSAQQAHERALENTVRREIEWLRRGPQGRGTKAKGRIKQAHVVIRELDDVRARNASGGTADIDFSATGRKTRDLITGHGLAKSRGGKTLFQGLEIELAPGDRLGLLGDNGSGKSTLLAILAGELELDSGTLKRARHLQVVVFHQDRTRLDPDATLRDTLCPEGDTVTYRGKAMHVTGWAKRFRFDPEQLMTRVGALSGGERARLLVADLVRKPADLILLDEPTNDLDLETREVLEESLCEFPGALVLVTHDRYMLERVCTSLLGLDGAGGAHRLADLDQWQRLRERLTKAAKASRSASKEAKAPGKPRNRGLTYKEKREWAAMEETIMAAEAQVETLQARVEAPEVMADHRLLEESYAALHETQQQVEALYARWEELEGKKGPRD